MGGANMERMTSKAKVMKGGATVTLVRSVRYEDKPETFTWVELYKAHGVRWAERE